MQSILHHSRWSVYIHCVLGKFTSLAFQSLFPHKSKTWSLFLFLRLANLRKKHCIEAASDNLSTTDTQHNISDIIMANCLVFISCAFVLSLHSPRAQDPRDFCPLSPTRNWEKKEGNIKSGLWLNGQSDALIMIIIIKFCPPQPPAIRRLLCNDNFPLKVLNED